MVRVESLAKEFRDPKRGLVHAVDGIDFIAEPGQVFGLIGDNGAGKTTTLRILSTLIAPTRGKAEVAGLDVVKDGEKVRANIGFMSGVTGLYGRLTPVEMLAYFGGLYGLEGDTLKSRIDELVAKFDISEFADRPCDKLSTGQKQRVGLARTIIHNPPVLFLDEPTSGLDVRASQAMMEFIEGARAQGKTVIFSSHIMSEVERLCDKVVVMHEGKICGAGTVEGLKAQTGQPTFEKTFLSLVGFYKEVSA